MCKHLVDQHLIILNLFSNSINKDLVTGFVTVKVSQNLNSMQKMSAQWNKQHVRVFKSCSNVCKHQPLEWVQKPIEYKIIGCKIFDLNKVSKCKAVKYLEI